MLENCDFIVIFLIYGQFGAIQKTDSRTWSIKLLLSLIVAFRLSKTENRFKKSVSSNTIALSKCIEFGRKCCDKKTLPHWCIIIKTLFKVLSIIIIQWYKVFGHVFECLLSNCVFVTKFSTFYMTGFLDSALVFVCWKNWWLPCLFSISFALKI